ncbi:biotin--[acetyl-CoA-carboxylase] ligase [Roseibium sp.]|uniref:biotin--[acetyl-CoA-carboxylase] ligase n=1 Tax=Roseibium sp. TaxID=1936156 RepID=UPI003A96EE0D
MDTGNPAPSAPGLRFEHHDTVGSTNTLAFERARAGDPGRLWISAGEQTQGRGRLGRDWASPRGNLFASHLLIDPGPANRLGELPLLAAVALAEAVDLETGAYHLAKLKWPNDLLIEGAKLSGILLEAETLPDKRLAVVLGFGVNCVSHPELSLYPSIDLTALGYRVTAEGLLAHLSTRLAHWLENWQKADGFLPVRAAWLARAAHLGQKITVRNASDEISGTFLDLNTQGHLVLRLDSGEPRTIYAGDVFLPDLKP